MNLMDDKFSSEFNLAGYGDLLVKGLPDLKVAVYAFDPQQTYQTVFGMTQYTDVIIHTHPSEDVIANIYVSNNLSPFWQAYMFMKAVGFLTRVLYVFAEDKPQKNLLNQQFFNLTPKDDATASDFGESLIIPKEKFVSKWNELMGDEHQMAVSSGVDVGVIDYFARKFGLKSGWNDEVAA